MLTGCAVCVVLVKFQLVVLVAISSPATGASLTGATVTVEVTTLLA